MSENLFNRARLPQNHWDCKLSEIPDEMKYKNFITQYTDDIRDNVIQARGLYLWGDFGSGKTGIAAIICKAAMNRGFMPLWISAEDIPAYMCEEIFFQEGHYMRERIFEVRLLVIDDLRLRNQKNIKSDWIERWLESIIRRRSDNKLCTVITSNDGPHKLKKLPAVYAITQEACDFVKIDGHQFRPEKGANSANDTY